MIDGLSPLTILWSMCASAALMLASMHLLLSLRLQRRAAYLLSALMAAVAGANALVEMLLMFTTDLGVYRIGLRIETIFISIMILSLVWFVYLYMGTASRRLALLVSGLWALSLGITVLSPNSVVFSELLRLDRHVTPWGEAFTIPVGVVNPWKFVADIADLLLIVYLAHATYRAYRAHAGNRIVIAGFGSLCFIVLGGIHTPLVDAGLVRSPYAVSFAFLAIVAALTYSVVTDAILSRRYEEIIQAGERRWQELLASAPLLIAGLDAAGKVNYANPQLLRTGGYSAEEIAGMPIEELLAPGDRQRARRLHEIDKGAQRDTNRQLALLTRDGQRRDVLWTTVELPDAAGGAEASLAIGIDRTDELRVEATLTKTRREIERMARATMLGEVAASLAHELNQPLAAILSNAQAARRFLQAAHPDIDELRAIVEDIVADDKRAGAVIHGLRGLLARSEGDGAPVDVNQTILQTCNLLAGEIRGHAATLDLDLAPGLPAVLCQRVQFQQIVINLILNALNAVDTKAPGERRVTIRTREAGEVVEISVLDTGVGIAENVLPHLFEPFVTTRDTGLGIGLAICRRIVESHGGRLSGQNRPGGGAEFIFALPITAVEARARGNEIAAG